MKRRLGVLLGTVLISASVLLNGCGISKQGASESNNTGNESSKQESTETKNEGNKKFGTVELPILDGSLCGAPFYIAYENGYFSEEGIDAKLIAADTETRKTGLNSGKYPITNGDFMFFQSIEQGVEVSVVEGLHNGCIQILTAKDSDIKSAEDLKGASIGVDEIGGPPYEATSIWLENHGVKASGSNADVKFLPYSDGNLELQALKNGDIKAAAIWDPIASETVKKGEANTLLDIGKDDIFADKYCCFVYASNKVLEENPDEIKAIIRALRKTEEFINEKPEETVDIIAKGEYSEVTDKKLAAELLSDYKYPTAKEIEAGNRNVKDTVVYFAEQLHKVGYLSTEADKLIDKLYKEVDVAK